MTEVRVSASSGSAAPALAPTAATTTVPMMTSSASSSSVSMATGVSGSPSASVTWARVCKECGQCHEAPEAHLYEYQDEVMPTLTSYLI